MIVFDVKCAQEHVFEAWFADSDTSTRQISGGKVACPICGDHKVAKAPMAPNIPAGTGRGRGRGGEPVHAKTANAAPGAAMAPPTPEQMGEAIKTLRKMREVVEKNFDNVGERFPEEARKIHHGEVEKRNIYGDASREEAQELQEEGIEISQMPWVPRHDS
ncbi:MAG: DUF1178 family protein [Proteobacteria bacterium]|nr:DUF1178 family protein [Pseudomonadota bacterium]MDA1356682.1 DUF1178 family protein [Pseudomonadota bacterium]